MRIASNAIVFICEWPVCRRIDDCTERFFLQHAMCCLCIPRDNGSSLKPEIIKRVPRIGVLGQLNLRSRLFETLDIGSAGSNLNVVIQHSVEDLDWVVGDVGVADVSRDARRIERNIGRRIDPAGIPQLSESFEGCIKTRLSAARESQQFGWDRPVDGRPIPGDCDINRVSCQSSEL